MYNSDGDESDLIIDDRYSASMMEQLLSNLADPNDTVVSEQHCSVNAAAASSACVSQLSTGNY